MANTIKLKRGSGSDPSASDLEVGELAIRTDSGKIFTKKDNGSVAEISGGGGIDDGDKGDITISNGGDTFTIDNGVVTSAKIADGAIVNADINASAAIDVSKLSGVLPLAGGTLTGNLTISNVAPKIFLTDTNNNDDFEIRNDDGTFTIRNSTDGNDMISVASDNTTTFTGNCDFSAGLDVTGAITATTTGTFTQAVTCGGLISNSNVTVENDTPSVTLNDINSENDFRITNLNGTFILHDNDAGATRMSCTSAGQFTFATNVDFSSGIDVTGNITGTGDLTISSTRPRITLNDTDSESDFEIKNENGSFRIRDIDNPTDRYRINSSGTIHEFFGVASFTSNIAVAGTVD